MLKIRVSADESKLIAYAENAVPKALAKQTNVCVGAAVGTRLSIYEGCNVESMISGLGVCAERNAINHAIIHELSLIHISEPTRPY